MMRVAVVGATGYTGVELVKILLRHPHMKLVRVTSESSGGKRLDETHPGLRGRTDLVLEAFDAAAVASDTDAAFFALPHAASAKAVAAYHAFGKKAVDLSADFRLTNRAEYERWYGVAHAAPALLPKAVYGLPELYRDKIRPASVIANPGCYATTTILALTPLLRNKLIDPVTIIVDAKSGVSGAGKKLASMYHFTEADENFQAYAVAKHRHTPEIEQILSDQAGAATKITFVPHLLPMIRGILVTAYASLKPSVSAADVRGAFAEAFGGERFIRLLPEGVWPQTKDVSNTNFVDINTAVDERSRRVVVLAALDNLVKGASGQAVQNLNLMSGFEETEALFG